MISSRRLQRGAVTLIGALFIVIVLSVMAISLLRMAGSNSLDSAVQNDAVEALFVAETGIEYASSVYAGSRSCIGLSGIGPVNAGRGSFSLGNAVVQPGGDCRVPVTASVGSAGNNPAVRNIVADLRLGGGNDGWIVGDKGTILRWNGSSWNAFASPTNNKLYAVYCVNATNCKAVGEKGTIIHWDGTAWSLMTSNTPADFFGRTNDLFAVSCEPNNPNNCFAAGGSSIFGFIFQGVIQHWDGISWSNVIDLSPSFIDWRFNDLSCPSTTCYVVTANGVIGRYDPVSGNWFNDNSNTAIPLNGVACSANNNCWAVGVHSGNNWNLDFRDATGWTPITVGVTNKANQNLNAVSCASAGDCWAVGNQDGSRYVLGQLIGTNWSQVTVKNGTQRNNLNAVHCLASNDCWAVGDYRNGGNVIHYDGAGWSYIGATVANNINLRGVHFPSGAGGGGSTVTLVRWQEIIGN